MGTLNLIYYIYGFSIARLLLPTGFGSLPSRRVRVNLTTRATLSKHFIDCYSIYGLGLLWPYTMTSSPLLLVLY